MRAVSAAPHAVDPRRRKSRERFARHARDAACCLRKAFVRSQTSLCVALSTESGDFCG